MVSSVLKSISRLLAALLITSSVAIADITVDGQPCTDTWSITQSAEGIAVVCGASGTPTPAEPEPEPVEPPSAGIERSWPNITRETFSASKEEVVSIRIKTGTSIALAGAINTATTTRASGVREITLSESPGDFTVTSPCASRGGETASLRWTTIQRDLGNYNSLYCRLKPSTTYYINIKHINCSSNRCYFFLSASS